MNIAIKVLTRLEKFQPVSLDEIQKASLMRRKDSKYVFPVNLLPDLLQAVSGDYRVLEIEEWRSHNYQTSYFDTPNLDMYLMHHNGRVNRHKIRLRRYSTNDYMFLEVKKKDAKGITVKNRVETGSMDASVMSTEEEFLDVYTPYECDHIIPVLENSFNRITLVSRDQTERVTLDYHLNFRSRISDSKMAVPGVSIAEIRYGGFLGASVLNNALRSLGVHPRRFSKYAIGMALLHPDLKQNLFKQKVRFIHKINDNFQQTQKEPYYA